MIGAPAVERYPRSADFFSDGARRIAIVIDANGYAPLKHDRYRVLSVEWPSCPNRERLADRAPSRDRAEGVVLFETPQGGKIDEEEKVPISRSQQKRLLVGGSARDERCHTT